MRSARIVSLCTTVLAIAITSGVAPRAVGGVISLHQSANDPTTEGFQFIHNFGTPPRYPVYNDMGLDAWHLAPGTSYDQAGYGDYFSAAEWAQIQTQGFRLDVTARITTGRQIAPSAPFYPSIGFGIDVAVGRRFDFYLGLNSAGDTVAMLADRLIGGANFYIQGPSYTLAGSDKTYHNYDFVYDATTGTADLFVDGVVRISGYRGQTGYWNGGMAFFGAFNGGEGNFNLFRLESGPASTNEVPEPSTLALCASGGVVLLFRRRFPVRSIPASTDLAATEYGPKRDRP